MELRGKVCVVTGGASGIGRALSRRFAAEGASVVVADLDGGGAAAVADEVGGMAVSTDVSVEADIQALVHRAVDACGPIDLFCSNAGITGPSGIDARDEEWQQTWQVNVMAHVYAARALLPSMLERGDGYILATASAAGLLMQLDGAAYSVTKHAAVAFAEWLSVTYGDRGLKVSCLCPQGVNTPMLAGAEERQHLGARAVLASGPLLEPEAVADAVVQGVREERFLILPHPEVATYMRRRADDHERWLTGMRRLRARTDT